MVDYNYYDFSGGIDKYNSKPLIGQKMNRLFWADSENVELLNNKGLKKMAGSTVIADMGYKILGLKEYIRGTNKDILVNTEEGKFYRVSSAGVKTQIKTGLDTAARVNYAEFIADFGVIVANGVDDPFYYYYSGGDTTSACNATTSGSHAIRSQSMAVYKSHIFFGEGATLYHSARGKYNDWTTASDSGSITNFHSDSSPIKALSVYKSYLAIHKENQSYLLSGDSAEDFSIIPFADKGALSPWGAWTINNNHYFYNNGLFVFEQVGELNQIRLGDDIAEIIIQELENVNKSQIGYYQILQYKGKNQLWFFIAKNSDEVINIIYIYDYTNKCWFKRVVPYNIVFAAEYNNGIITGTDTGLILQEAVGSDFNGANIDFIWYSPYLHFGMPNKKKTIDEMYYIFDSGADNKFLVKTREDYNDYEIYNQTSINMDSGSGSLWDELVWDVDDWASEGTIESERDNISGSNKAFQLIFMSAEDNDNINLLGIEFRDITIDE